jgi:3',5'-cyclic AMP phosphodiesterase CpdA
MKTQVKKWFLILFLLLAIPFSQGQTQKDLTFASMSDTHFDLVNPPDMTSIGVFKKINSLSECKLPAALGAKKVGPLAMLLIVGDITGDGLADQWYNPKLPDGQNYVKGIKHLSSSIPVYEVLGNHDCPPKGPVPGHIAAKYGKTYYSFDKNGVHFIVLDPYLKGDAKNPSLIPDELKWLEKDLAVLAPKTRIVFAMHNRPDSLGPGNMDSLDPASSKALADLIRGKNVILFLRGHTHRGSHNVWNGIDSVSSGFVFSRKACPPWSANPDWTSTFLVVRITDTHLFVVEYNWEKNAWGRVYVNRTLNH